MTAASATTAADDLERRAAEVAEVARAHADEVDRDARFPQEALDAARERELLALLVAPEEGGEGAGASAVGRVTEAISRGCPNAGMVYAMHQNQLAALVRHGGPGFAERRRAVAAGQLLIASATTEIGIGGDIRRSTCAVEPGADGTFTLVKNAPVISYAEHADALVLTARRDPDAAPNDQVLVYATRDVLELERTSDWNTLGFRGTCSPGFIATVEASQDAILPLAFADISARTMLPCSHIYWASVWLGMATEAAMLARRFVQKLARKTPGTPPPSALHVAELQIALHELAASVHEAAERFDRYAPDAPELGSVAFAAASNGLKITASRAVMEIVTRAMTTIGIGAYRLEGEFSLARLLRDAIGPQLMVSNDRILAASAALELVNRSER